MTLRENFSLSRSFFYDSAEKNATRSHKKEEVGTALKKPHLPPFLWGFRKKDN
jgi:hypothetical protein